MNPETYNFRDEVWRVAREEVYGEVGLESSYDEAESLIDAIDSGRIIYDNLTPAEKRGVDLGRRAVETARRLEAEFAGGNDGVPPQNAVQSDTERSSGGVEEYFGNFTQPEDSYPVFDMESLRRSNVAGSRDDQYEGPVFKTAMLKALTEGKSLTEAAAEAATTFEQSGDAEGMYRAQAASAVDAEERATLEQLEEMDLYQDPQDVQDTIQATADYLTELRASGKDPDVVLWSLAANPDIREETIKGIAMDHKIREAAAKAYSDMSKIDVGLGFLRDFLLPLNFYDNLQLTGSAFNAEEYMQNFIQNFRSLPVAEQEAAWPSLEKWISDELPELKAIGVMQAFASAEGARDLEDFSTFWAVFDAAEAALIAGKVAKFAVKINQVRKVAKDMKALGRGDDIAEGVAAAAVSEADEAAKMLGMDKRSITNTLSPMSTEDIDPSSVDGLSKKAFDKYVEFDNRARAWEQKTLSDELTLQEGAFTDAQRAEIEREKINQFLQKFSVQDAKVIERDRSGFKLEYEAFDEDGVSLGRMTEDFKFTLEDARHWEVDTVGMLGQYVFSPLAMFKSDDTRALARQAQRLDNLQAQRLNEMRWLYREALSPVVGDWGVKVFSGATRKKLADLDYVLLKGDQELAGTGRDAYSIDELRSGVLGVRLKDDQIEAYYRIRSLVKTLGRVRNESMRREKMLRGEKGFVFNDTQYTGKVYADTSSATASLNDSGRKFIHIEGEGDALRDGIDLGKMYQEGYSLVRLDAPMDMAGDGNKVFYALIKNDNITELPEDILSIREGYVPKINMQTAYFVREHRAHTVDGTPIAASDTRADSKVVRAFARKDEADAFVQKMQEKAIAEGKTLDEVRYERYEDRELEKTKAISTMGDEHQLGRPGGLFTGARAEDLLWGDEGVSAPRVDSFTAISHYISNLSRYSSRNEWRLGMEAAALKTANQLAGRGNRVFRSFDQLAEAPVDTETGIIIRNLHRQIEDWMNWPTADELWFSHAVQKVIDSSMGSLMGDKARGMLFDLKQKDPAAAMRATAFHGMLGWFNPVQLWVQAQGAAIAASMNIFKPHKLALALKDQGVLRVMQGTLKTDEQIRHAAKSFGADQDRTLELIRAWQRSGLEDSVLATADHAAAMNGRGVAMDSLSRAAQKGLLFYQEGELFNRRFSFATAFEEWKAANKGKALDDEGLRSIIDRTHNLTLNMGKANRARWQRGILGTATQFQQVSAKTLESLLGLNGNFTGKERAKIMLGQAALYGGAGVPMGTMGTQWVAEMLGYDSISDVEENMDPATVKLINEGFAGWFTLMATGVDVDIGRRSSLNDGIEGIVESILYGEGSLASNVLGAFSGTAGNFWKGLFGTYEPFSLTLAKDRPVSVINLATNPLINSISSFRNADKALFMDRMDVILGKDMTPVALGPFNWKESLAVAMGFTLSREKDVYDLRKLNKIEDDYRKAVVNEIVRMNYQAVKWFDDEEGFSEQRQQWFEQATAALIQSLDNPWQQQEAIKAVEQKLRDSKKDPRAVEYHKWRQRNSDDSLKKLMSLQEELSGKGLMKQYNDVIEDQ